MQRPEGKIIQLCTDGAATSALVEVEAGAICARCEAGKGCGAGLLGRASGDKCVKAVIAANLDVRAGDRVSIELAPQHVLRAALIVYGLPLAGAVMAAVLAFSLSFGEAKAVLASLFGLAAGVLIARSMLGTSRCVREFTPTVVARLSPAAD